MSIKDRFNLIREYIDEANIVDEIVKFLGTDDLEEFCDFLIDEFNVHFDDDMYGDEYLY